jgi:hypothetical protein
MAVKIGTKKSTVKKGMSTPKAKKKATTGAKSELDEAMLLLSVRTAEAQAEIKELARVVKETELAFKQERIESERKWKQERIESERKREQERKESERKWAQDRKESEENLKSLGDFVKNGLGGLRNSIGSIVEMVLLPGLAKKINELGHKFTSSSYRNEFYRKDGSRLAEIDLLLANGGNEVMVVEAKTFFEKDDVDALLRRVQKLRAEETLTRMEGKTLYAAAAGVNFTDDARQMIKEKGIYMVSVNEDNDKIIVSPLTVEEAGKW